MKFHLLAILFLVILSVTRLLLMVSYGLCDDEAYYWEWSRNLAAGYYDNGPGVAYAIAAGTWLFGDTEIGLRFPAFIFGIIAPLIAYSIGLKIFQSRRAAFFAMLLWALTPINYIGSLIMMHDSVMYLFWVLFACWFIKFIETRQNLYIYLCGFCLGFGILAKYTMLLLVPTIFLFLFLTNNWFLILKNKHFYVSTLITMLLIAPMVYWNFTHDWIGFKFVTNRHLTLSSNQPFYVTFIEFIGSQAGGLNPFTFFLLVRVLGQELFKKDHDHTRKFLALTSVFMFSFFLALSLKQKVEANWPVCCYFGGLVLVGGEMCAKWNEHKKYSPIICTIISLIFIASVIFPKPFIEIVRAIGINIQQKMILSNRLIGGKEIANDLEQLRSRNPHAIIFANRYQPASVMAFYLKDHPRIYSLNVASRRNQYDLWESPNVHKGKDFIFVCFSNKEPPLKITRLFSSYIIYPPRQIMRFNEPIRDYRFAYMKKFKGIDDLRFQ